MDQCRHPEGCSKDAKPGRNGWCSMHYTRIRKSGSPGPPTALRQRNQGKPCAVDGCVEDEGKGASIKGFCMFHYHRWKQTGDPGPPNRVIYDRPTCVDCGLEKSSFSAERCWDCYLKTKSGINENKICPSCGGPKSWESDYCQACRWVRHENIHDPYCVDCGAELVSRTKTRCWDCYREHKGFISLDGICQWPDCDEQIAPRGARGKCQSHYAEYRNRLKILKSDRPFKVALFSVSSHSFRDKDEGFSFSSRRLSHTIKKRLLKRQGKRCVFYEWCGESTKTLSNNPSKWHLDHDHSCGRHHHKRMCQFCIRGVLCPRCNMQMLGALEKVAGDRVVDLAQAVLRYVAAV